MLEYGTEEYHRPLPDMPPAAYPAEANPACGGCNLVEVCLRGMRRAENEDKVLGAMAEETEYTAPDRAVATGTVLDDVMDGLVATGALRDATGEFKQQIIEGQRKRALEARADGVAAEDAVVEVTGPCSGPKKSRNLRTLGQTVCGLTDETSRGRLTRIALRRPAVVIGEVVSHAGLMDDHHRRGNDTSARESYPLRPFPPRAKEVLAAQVSASQQRPTA